MNAEWKSSGGIGSADSNSLKPHPAAVYKQTDTTGVKGGVDRSPFLQALAMPLHLPNFF